MSELAAKVGSSRAAGLGAALTLLGAWLWPGPAGACNHLFLQDFTTTTWQGASGTGYEGFQPISNPEAITFTVRKNGPSGCSYFVAVTPGSGGSFDRKLANGGHVLNYNIYDTLSLSAVLKDLPTATMGEIVTGTFIGGGNQLHSHTVYFNIPPQQVVPTGTYSDTVRFRAYMDGFTTADLEDSENVTFQAQVANMAEVSIVDTGGIFDATAQVKTIDFGVMSEGQRRAVDILVRSNSGYDLSLQSENAGVMRITDPSDTSTVPYTLTLNGGTVDLTGGGAVPAAGANGNTGPAGDRLPTEVTLGAIDGASAGNYRDYITVVVTAR